MFPYKQKTRYIIILSKKKTIVTKQKEALISNRFLITIFSWYMSIHHQ